MNSVRITYLICDLIFSLSMVTLAVVSPIWITPGYYWWTAFSLLALSEQSHSYTKRVNGWDGMGKYD